MTESGGILKKKQELGQKMNGIRAKVA